MCQFVRIGTYTHTYAYIIYIWLIDTIVSIRMDRYIHAHARIYYEHTEIDTVVSISMDWYMHAHARIYYIHIYV